MPFRTRTRVNSAIRIIKAACAGEYNYPINEREIDDDSCPYCKETRVLPGYNSFKIKHPNLMEEWDYINNYLLCDANHILDNSINKV